MSTRTLEVEWENGVVKSVSGGELPARGHGHLIVGSDVEYPAKKRSVLDWLETHEKMPQEEADAFAEDIRKARERLPPLKSAWD